MLSQILTQSAILSHTGSLTLSKTAFTTFSATLDRISPNPRSSTLSAICVLKQYPAAVSPLSPTLALTLAQTLCETASEIRHSTISPDFLSRMARVSPSDSGEPHQ